MIEAALFAVVTGDAGVAALIGTRLYPGHLPQNPTYEAMTYRRVNTGRPHAHDGPGDLAKARFQFSCFGATYSAARTLANTLRTAIDGYKGTVAGVRIDGILFIDEQDAYEDETGVYMLPIDFRVIHKEG